MTTLDDITEMDHQEYCALVAGTKDYCDCGYHALYHAAHAFFSQKYHNDDAVVDSFAQQMKFKLHYSRERGRGGWEDMEVCPPGTLAPMLNEHVQKGDPVDVANFAMMLWARGEKTGPLLHLPGWAIIKDSTCGAFDFYTVTPPNGPKFYVGKGQGDWYNLVEAVVEAMK